MKTWPIVLLLILSSASALQIYGHDIQIRIEENDTAQIEEVYRLKFETPEEKQGLKDIFAQPELDTSLLGQYGLQRAISEGVSDEKGQPLIGESDFADVKVSYTAENLVEMVQETGKKQLMEIQGNKFSFWDGEKFTLPYETPTDLKIFIPSKYELKELKPIPYENRTEEYQGERYQELNWNYKGPVIKSDFYVRYEKELTISSMFSIENFLREIQTRYLTNPVYVIAAIIVIIMIIWYRKEFGMMITETFSGEPEHEELKQQDE